MCCSRFGALALRFKELAYRTVNIQSVQFLHCGFDGGISYAAINKQHGMSERSVVRAVSSAAVAVLILQAMMLLSIQMQLGLDPPWWCCVVPLWDETSAYLKLRASSRVRVLHPRYYEMNKSTPLDAFPKE